MSEKMASSSTTAGSSGGETSPRPPSNQFQKSGIDTVYEVKETNKACLIRVDMPGCPASDLNCALVPELRYVIFSAVEPAKPEYNYVGRKYEGMMVFPEGYNATNAKIEMGDGVIWIAIPKIPGTTNSTIAKVMHLHFKKPDATA